MFLFLEIINKFETFSYGVFFFFQKKSVKYYNIYVHVRI